MALVPFRVSGRAADHDLEERLIQFGPHIIRIDQDPVAGKHPSIQNNFNLQASEDDVEVSRHPTRLTAQSQTGLENVGRVVWQCGFLLADYLIRRPPFRDWGGVNVVDLGAGTGVVGIALAKAGAVVTFTDLPHITPITSANLAKNSLSGPQCKIVDYAWGEAADKFHPLPDVITGGDLLYERESHAQLMDTLARLSAPHTILYLSFRSRGDSEEAFLQQFCERGFHIGRIPRSDYHEEYQDEECGRYHIIQATKLL